MADTLHTHPKVPLKCKNGDGGIYGILNRNSGKLYVGSAICLRKRWNSHRQSLNGNCHHNQHLQNSFNKNSESFEFVLIESVAEKKSLIEKEQFWINFFQSYDESLGYNARKFAHSNFGMVQSEAAKLKVSVANKGRKRTLEQNLRQSARSLGRKGTPMTDQNKLILSQRIVGRKWKSEWSIKGNLTRSKNKKEWIPVIQMDLDGNEIARFDSVSKANIAMGREKASAINQVLSGLLKTAFGFKWRKLHE